MTSAKVISTTPPLLRKLTTLALAIALVVVLVRLTMLETIRDIVPLGEVGADIVQIPDLPGAAASTTMDLVGLIPAVLVLVRRVIDPTFALRTGWAHVLLGALAAWSLLSVAWADDKFAALIGASGMLSAAGLTWAVSQLVRDWRELRVVVGVAVGVLAALVVQGVIYHFAEHPQTVQTYTRDRDEILRQQGIEPGTFEAQQFEKRVMSGALMGFTRSPNTHGALVVTLTLVAIGAVAQRIRDDRTETGWAGVPLLAVLGGLFVLWRTGSNASIVALSLGLVLLCIWLWMGRWMSRHHGYVFALVVLGVLLLAMAVVGVGIYTGGLPHDSINFRWRYWVGSLGVWLDRPVLGVGWNNFGNAYLEHRLPSAVEDIKDPHNFAVKLATEVGAVGLLLGLGWVATTAWTITRRVESDRLDQRPPVPVMPVLGVAAIAAIAGMPLVIDFGSDPAFVIVEMLRRGLLFLAVALGVGAVTVRSLKQSVLDDRPADWQMALIVIGLGTLLLQSAFDMVLLDPPGLALASLLGGATMGVRSHAVAAPVEHRAASLVALSLAAVAWLAVLCGIAVPTAVSEYFADRSLEQTARREYAGAIESLSTASGLLPVPRADLHRRAAFVAMLMPGDQAATQEWLDRAVDAEPRNPTGHLDRARWNTRRALAGSAGSDALFDQLEADYRRVIDLNPAEIDVRLEFAQVLLAGGRPTYRDEAAEQIQAALDLNSRLDPAEPKRLARETVETLTAQLRLLTQDGSRVPATRAATDPEASPRQQSPLRR